MSRTSRVVVVAWLAMMLGGAPGLAIGQVGVRRRPLGGYGAMTIMRSYRTEMGSSYLPYAGGFGGYIAQRALEPRPPVGMATNPEPAPRTPIGGTGMARTPIGGVSRMGGRGVSIPGGAMGRVGLIRSPSVGMPGVMPPRLGSPFGAPSVLGGG
ncbi:hypothetical protein [Tautonia plasticadhaerens]|uniref:Uncharacterized protein n=1 Tax=Tautonia plasticadhaerens TaxID=2527974 RepID=A0A518H1L9_9BACT|nr:hypothetical protein [Tautonia plasticadhaerens]QDV34739.1 hypothetical protein ElP_26330 [Tautonia plasticadhaerens]